MPSFHSSSGDAVWPVSSRLTSIGAAADNDIVLKGSGVEPAHALLQFDGKEFILQTTHRSIEFSVNGKKKRKVTLADGDVIGFGSASLRFSILDAGKASETSGHGSTWELDGFKKLNEISKTLLGKYDVEELLENLMDAVVEITHARKGFLILAEGDGLEIKVARNVKKETILDAAEQVSDSIIDKVHKTHLSVIVSDALNDDEFNASQSVINLNLSSVMCVPLLDRGKMLGLIYCGNDDVKNLFTQRHLELLTSFAAQASLVIANALFVNELRFDNEQLHRLLHEKRFGRIIGSCDVMRDVYRTIEKVAPTGVNVLVLGETGTGKELVAHEIHSRSNRAAGPFVTINCGAIPESLLESELFGHVKGAFTGAISTREGKFQAAHKGTIFLDEIGEMPVNLQVKLLRVLQERTITKVGATSSELIDIRVVAATNRDLEKAVKAGEFREDLFYRLNVVMMRLPPLRDRGADAVLIAKFLVGEIAVDLKVPPKALAQDAILAVQKYDWPGNIRQLENRLKKALVLCDGATIGAEDLDLEPEMLTSVMNLADAKEHFALRYVRDALERNNGNRTQTAKELGVDPRTIFRYLEKDSDDVGL